MRIAYFSDNFYPEISGIGDSIITTGEELRKRGHEVLYVAPRYGKKDYIPILKYDINKKIIPDSRELLNTYRLPSLSLPNSPTGQSRFEIPLGFALTKMHEFKPDIIHAQSPHGLGLEAAFAASLLDIPLIGTEHTPVEEFAHYGGGGLFGTAWLKWEIVFYNWCAFVTAPYQGLIDDMRKRGLKAPGRGQANPVPFASTPSSAEEKRAAKETMTLQGPILFCSGRLAPEKKVDEILKATALVAKEFPTVTLLITGHGSAENNLKKLAKELYIEKNVQFLGFVNSEMLPTLYQAADIYLIMSTAETQSLSLMQAFAAGIPAISARARGLADYTPPDCGLLVQPGDVAGLAAGITKLLKDESLRTQMGLAGAKFVTTLTPERIAIAWEEIYTNAITQRLQR